MLLSKYVPCYAVQFFNRVARYDEAMPNPKGTPAALGVTPLADGELSELYRIRAASAIHEWLSLMTAAERGEVLTRVHRELQKPKPKRKVPPETLARLQEKAAAQKLDAEARTKSRRT